MKTRVQPLFIALLLFSTLGLRPSTVFAQGTAFTYQGRLNDSGGPAGGTYSLKFTLFNTNITGVPIAGPLTNNAVNVTNGLFTVLIDFGPGAFTGASNWLEIAVETNGVNPFTTLVPRQQLTPTPYAVYAEGASAAGLSGTIPAASLGGTYGNAVNLNNPGNSFAGNGAGVANVNATALNGLNALNFWQTTGNSGTTPGVNFAGTTDSNAFEIHVNGTRVLRLEPDSRGGNAGNLIGGHPNNAVLQPGSGGDVIAGGGFTGGGNVINSNSSGIFIGAGSLNQVGPNVNDAVIAGGNSNTNISPLSLIGGGYQNSIQPGNAAVISGGYQNFVGSNSYEAVIAGGAINTIGPNAYQATIGGGLANTNASPSSTIGGGNGNVIQAGGQDVTIGGGGGNLISSNCSASAIAGGSANLVATNVNNGFIGGGYQNHVTAGMSVIVGGWQNTASGSGSLVGGGGFDGTSVIGNLAGGNASVVVGGLGNANLASISFIGSGLQNSIQPGNAAVIGGGYQNLIESNSYEATIAGGWANSVGTNAYQATIAGGSFNTNMGPNSTIGGGELNTVSNSSATVPGGLQNVAGGSFSFAAGYYAQALQTGTFVWADAEGTPFSSTAANQFNVRASGGLVFVTGGAGMTLDGLPVVTFFNGGGSGNFFVQPAGRSTTSGSDNTAEGFSALQSNTTGSENTANGYGALFLNTNGFGNTANGVVALDHNTDGSYNTANGAFALYYNTNGSYNTADGYGALDLIAGGSNNIALGFEAGLNIATGSSNIDIGNTGLSTDANIIRIGSGQSQTFIAGVITNAGTMTLKAGADMDLTANGNVNVTAELAAELKSGTTMLLQSGTSMQVQSAAGLTLLGSFFSFSGGDVGIGTASPQQALSVVGGLNLDQGGQNIGNVNSNALTFGSGSGEGFASKRTSGGSPI